MIDLWNPFYFSISNLWSISPFETWNEGFTFL